MGKVQIQMDDLAEAGTFGILLIWLLGEQFKSAISLFQPVMQGSVTTEQELFGQQDIYLLFRRCKSLEGGFWHHFVQNVKFWVKSQESINSCQTWRF